MLVKLVVGFTALAVMVLGSSQALASHRDNQPPTCTCSASLSFARPSLQWSGGTLTFIPKVNYSIRTRGDAGAPLATVSLHHEGSTSYSSDDISVPSGVSFSGDRNLVENISCGSRYSFSGYQLPAVSLTGVTRALVGEDQELDGKIQMKATMAGCGFEEENRQFSFTVKEFGNLFVRSWRSVR